MWSNLFSLLPIEKYGGFILGLIVGVLLVTLYHRCYGHKALISSFTMIIEEKNARISDLAHMIGRDLEKVQASPENAAIFKNIRQYFRNVDKTAKKKKS